MSLKDGESRLDFRLLEKAYRETWEQFCAEVGVFQSLLRNAETGAVLERAKSRVACAERLYRENRDKLAQYMLAGVSRRSHPQTHFANRDGATHDDAAILHVQVKRLAYQFWEDGGWRHGNADGIARKRCYAFNV